MTVIQAIILGIVQGITEFLPISSSGHLVLVPFLLGWEIPTSQIFPFDVLVQIGTLIAVIIFYWPDLLEIARSIIKDISDRKPFQSVPARTGWLTILATIPAGIIGLAFKTQIEAIFSSPVFTAGMLLITGTFIILSERYGKKTKDISKLNWVDALVMGFSQAFAVLPGISRSGSAISGGLFRNLERKSAGQFAFLMAIPIMLAAGLLSVIDLVQMPNLTDFLPIMFSGLITSGIVGYFSIKWLLGYIKNNNLTPFAIYCFILGAGTLILSFLNPNLQIMAVDDPEKIIYHVSYQPVASWLLSDMYTCNDRLNEVKFLFNQDDVTEMPEEADVFISYGELSPSPADVFQVGNDTYLLVANEINPLNQVTKQGLIDIQQGLIVDPNSLSISCQSCDVNEEEQGIFQIWMYPPESSISKNLSEIYENFPISSKNIIAPSPDLLKQALYTDTFSMGFLPGRMLDDGLKVIEIQGFSQENLTIPILISSQPGVIDEVSNWAACLQQSIE